MSTAAMAGYLTVVFIIVFALSYLVGRYIVDHTPTKLWHNEAWKRA